MIHIAVVEDEDIYAQQIEHYLGRFAEEKGIRIQTDRFRDGDEIAEDYQGEYDIILMDIQMEFMDGMTAAERIRKLDQKVVIMFITNLTEYAVRGYEVSAVDYVVKPVEYLPFARKMGRAVSMVEKESLYLSVPTDGGMMRLSVEFILYVEVRDHTLIYHTQKEVIQAKGRIAMKEVEQELVKWGFFRCSNCALVNLRWVDSVKDAICTVGKETVQISRTRKKAFMEALVNHISGGAG